MSQSSHVVDLEVDGFERQVVERSRAVPVLVDLWAAWCQPCRMLAPILESLATEMNGAFELVKVDTDRHQDVARSLQVNGIPDVRLFVDGKVVDAFTGVIPEAEVRRFLSRHLKSEVDELIAAAETMAREDSGTTRTAWEAVLRIAPGRAEALVGLAKVALAEGDFDQVRGHVAGIALGSAQHEVGQNLIAAIQIVQSAQKFGTAEHCAAVVAAEPQNREALFATGGHALGAGDYESALASFLSLVKLDRKWGAEAGRQAMLVVFSIIGVRSAMADEFRDFLSRALY